MNDQDRDPLGLRRLRQDAAPHQDLWPGIQLRLRPRRLRAPWIGLALAASLVAGLAFNLRQQTPELPELEPQAQTQTPALAASPELRAPDRALVRANLKIVDDAEKQLLDALKRQPGAPSLQRLLDNTRQQRRDLRRLLASPA